MTGRTLFDKVWDLHVVDDLGDGMQLMFVDRHVVHELSGHRGHAEMAKRGLKMRNPELSLGSMDHVVSTVPGSRGGNTPNADRIIEAFRTESRRHGMNVYDIGEDGQGIVHVIGPETGFTHSRHPARLRRQPHLHARGAGRARLGHRHHANSCTCSPRRPWCSRSRRRCASISAARRRAASPPRT